MTIYDHQVHTAMLWGKVYLVPWYVKQNRRSNFHTTMSRR